MGQKTMSGYQFAHVDGYGRKGGKNGKTKERVLSMSEIAAEAERHPDAIPHIENPKPPILLFGVMPSVVVKEAEEWAKTAKDAIGRKLRIDGMCMDAGVVSFPADRIDEWPAYRDEAIEWLKKKYGDNLKSIVEHTDEPYPHFHFYVVPKKGEKFESIHEGYAAMNAVPKDAPRIDRKHAFGVAMKGWQDEVYLAFGMKYGLARTGPRRGRLTRAEWKERQAVAVQIADLMRKATDQKAEAELQAAAVLQSAEQQAAALLQDSKNQSTDVLQNALDLKVKAELNALEVRKAAEVKAAEMVRKAEEQAKNIEQQAAELLQRAGQEKQVNVLNDDINAMIDTEESEHKAGLLRNGEDLYTRKQVFDIAGKAAVNAVKKQFKATMDYTAATALAIAKANTEIDAETASELASLKKQVMVLSNTITKKDADYSKLKADNDKRLNQLGVAKIKVESADDRASKAEARANEQEARADRLARDLSDKEDELRELKQEHGLDAGLPKFGR